MEFAELLILAIGLSMDAFAISICKGLSVEKLEKRHMLITGLWFGGSQMAMPILGYFVGGSFYETIQSVDHWLSFALLLLIGVFGSLGQAFITYAYRFAPASEISIYNYSGIIFSMILGFFILGEPVKFTSVIGGALVAAASVMVYVYNNRSNKKAGDETTK